MKKMLAAVATTAAVAAIGAAPGAAQAATQCKTKLTGKVPTALVVPAGEVCTLDGAEVSGAVTVQPGGRLKNEWNHAPITIHGALTANGARVYVCHGRIDGNVTVTGAPYVTNKTTAVIGGCIEHRLSIGGSVKQTNNHGETYLGAADVAGSVTATGNDGGSHIFWSHIAGAVTLSNNHGEYNGLRENTIGGSLTCFGNTPAPVNDGYTNIVTGARSGQCLDI